MSAIERQSLQSARRWVIKVGSALLTAGGRRLDRGVIHGLVQQLVALKESGCEVVLVSSGSVAAGIVRLGLEQRPTDIHELQAAAAVGQSVLIRAYEDAMGPQGLVSAMVLLSHADVRARDRYLNARGALNTLLARGVLPIINENDTVVTDEIRLGDNDTLGALVANLIDADALLILTDQDGLYDQNPLKHPDAALITEADVEDSSLDSMVGEAGKFGRGGMVTKLGAARLAARSGALTVIANGQAPNVIQAVARGEQVGTFLTTQRRPQSARKQWLASLLHPKGVITLDAGATKMVVEAGKSLLPIGVVGVEGQFVRGDLVRCVSEDGREVARGLINYNADEASKLIKVPSNQIPDLLGYGGDPEMIHSDNLVRV